ncbi:MAG: Uma2 family endonuclease [Acidobacteria bacterium]|nr:MAG: Uma2 family endonuclease [Acidobacteriota bacterium]
MASSSPGQRRKGGVKKTAMASHQLMTTEEYLRTPERLSPAELIHGVLRVADAPLPHHQRAVRDLCFALVEHAESRHLGEVWISPLDVILDAERALIVQPDLLFISNERSHILTDRVCGAPDLVVEVLSPNPRIGGLRERIAWFAEYGVRECWLVYQPERKVEVLDFVETNVIARASFDERTPIRSQVLPDFDRTLASMLRWR